MREYGLIGYHLSHSFSQKYFTEKFKKEEIGDAEFHAFAIPSIADLPQLLSEHPLLKGFAITIPYKKSVIHYLDEISDTVKATQACNCVKINVGKLSGFNTDVAGFERSFMPHLLPHHKKALILGTGGAAAAVQYVLQKLQIDYCFVSRNNEKEKGILTYADLNAAVIKEYTVIINCTPSGTYPKIEDAPDIPYDLLTPEHYLFDLVYNPALTKFLKSGAAHKAIIQNGYDMLVIQAEENWKIWNE